MFPAFSPSPCSSVAVLLDWGNNDLNIINHFNYANWLFLKLTAVTQIKYLVCGFFRTKSMFFAKNNYASSGAFIFGLSQTEDIVNT
jgi:hypothetical protein